MTKTVLLKRSITPTDLDPAFEVWAEFVEPNFAKEVLHQQVGYYAVEMDFSIVYKLGHEVRMTNGFGTVIHFLIATEGM